MRKITVTDMTLRKETTAGAHQLSFKEKIDVAHRLDMIGVDVIDLAPIVDMRVDTLLVHTISAAVENAVLSLPAGMTEAEIDSAWAALKGARHPRLCLTLPVSTVQMEYVCHKKAPKMLDMITSLTKKCAALCTDVEFCALDATRCEDGFLESAIKTALASGATAVSVCDSASVMLPDEMAALTKSAVSAAGNTDVTVLCENGMGTAAASSVMSLREGAAGVKCAIGDDRYADLETVAKIVSSRGDSLGIYTGLSVTEITRLSDQIARICSGTKCRKTLSPGTVSDKATISFTISDTAENIAYAVKRLGYDLSEEDNAKVYEEFRRVAEKKNIGEAELEAIVASTALQVPPTYRVMSYVVNTGNIITASSHVQLEKNGAVLQGISLGDGPIDSSFLAIEHIIGHHYELDDFQIQAVTEGREAVGSALIRLRSGGKLYCGNGISTDIIGASIRAYINALNKIVWEEGGQ